MDPSGLVTVTFYDPDDVLYTYLPNGDISGQVSGGFEEYADDFKYNYEMKNFGDILNALYNLRHKEGAEVTEIYIYDHCMNDAGQNVTGLEFGKSKYKFEGGELEKYTKLFGFLREKGYLTEDATINFRHCFLGLEQNKSKLENLAEWTKGNVTGVNGWILHKSISFDRSKGDNGWDKTRVPWHAYYFINE